MTTKTTNLLYWLFTILFAGLMIFTAIPNIAQQEDSVKFMHEVLGYPVYFVPFIGVAKLLGSLTLLVPGFKRLKEWAYAGLFFDLAGAIYSGIAVAKAVDPRMLFLLLWIVPGILSYYFWHKKQNAR
jgi:hypothetical protein